MYASLVGGPPDGPRACRSAGTLPSFRVTSDTDTDNLHVISRPPSPSRSHFPRPTNFSLCHPIQRTSVLQLDSNRIVAWDGIEVATGQLINVNNTPFDFRRPTRIGEHVDEAVNACGTGCTGYDNCWLFDYQGSQLMHKGSMYSPKSGIR